MHDLCLVTTTLKGDSVDERDDRGNRLALDEGKRHGYEEASKLLRKVLKDNKIFWRADEPLKEAIREDYPERLRAFREGQERGSISENDLANIECGYRAALKDVLGKT